MSNKFLKYLLFAFVSILVACSFDEAPQGVWGIKSEIRGVSHASNFKNPIFFDTKNGLVQSQNALHQTKDSGESWNEILSFERGIISALAFSDSKTGWLLVRDFEEMPYLMNSTDGGLIWKGIMIKADGKDEILASDTIFNDFCLDRSGRGWIISRSSIFAIEIRNGTAYVSQEMVAKSSLMDIECTKSGEVWAVSLDGEAYRRKNGWAKIDIDKKSEFDRVRIINGDIWVLGFKTPKKGETIAKGTVFRSIDHGITWEDKTPEGIRPLRDISIVDGKGWMVGDYGTIYSTIDNGDSWNKFESPADKIFFDIFFLNTDNIWITGTHETILKFEPITH